MDFSDNYTQNISDYFWGYNSPYMDSCKRIKDDIENISESITREEFRKKLEEIRTEYLCSSRRFLVEHIKGLASCIHEDGSFEVVYGNVKYCFRGSGMEQIKNMNTEEKKRYIDLLTRISVENSRDYECEDAIRQWRLLYRKAMLDENGENVMHREDVFRIAHGLKFTLEMAEEYLVRATDNEGIDYNKPEDLIEMFCFLHPEANNYHVSEELNQKYERASGEIARKSIDEKPQKFTAMMEKKLPGLVKEWEQDVRIPVEERMLEWLLQETPLLNLASQTARRVYSGLVYLAYQLITDERFSDENEAEEVSDIVMSYALDRGIPGELDIYKIVDKILGCAANSFDNRRVKNKRLFGTLWRYITIDEKGEIKTKSIGSTMPDLILGNQSVTKADLLFILWFVCELLWSYTQEEPDFYEQLSDFWTLAEDLLEEAKLPAFYAPHLLEQSMLLSLCMGTEENSPFEVYELICEELNPVKRRKRKKQDVNPDEPSTQELRKLREAEIRADYKNDRICWDGVEKELLTHLQKHGAELGQYIFDVQGISYYPNPEIVIAYPDSSCMERFDQRKASYDEEPERDQRFTYLYSLYLYLREECKKNKIRLKCRINYRKNCMIQILDYSAK